MSLGSCGESADPASDLGRVLVLLAQNPALTLLWTKEKKGHTPRQKSVGYI